MKSLVFAGNYKRLGLVHLRKENAAEVTEKYLSYIKILLLPAGYLIRVDFNRYETLTDTLFFVNANQVLHIEGVGPEPARLIFYNRDFYCVQIHDAEVACDGLLFNNLFEVPKVELSQSEATATQEIYQSINDELAEQEDSSEEMIRIYLKQLIIRATRSWKKQNLQNQERPLAREEQDFFREFSRLVELHFRKKHAVADYAGILGIAPKTLSSRFNKLSIDNPNEIIKNRIVLEAKRLLTYTSLSIKEIGYQLGYDDPAYFNRMFAQKVGCTPAVFKKNFAA